jgi:hypothetical protein
MEEMEEFLFVVAIVLSLVVCLMTAVRQDPSGFGGVDQQPLEAPL